MRSDKKSYAVEPAGERWNAVLNGRVVYSATSKAQVLSLARHAAQANAPSTVTVRSEDGETETVLTFGYEMPVLRPLSTLADA